MENSINMRLMPDILTSGEHTKHAVYLLKMSVIYFFKDDYESALRSAKKARDIIVSNLGHYHYLHGLVLTQMSLILKQQRNMNDSQKYHQGANEIFASLQLENRPNISDCKARAKEEQEQLNDSLENNIEVDPTNKVVLYQMIDFPFAWVDFYQSKHYITFGADSQVWEHLEKLKTEYPFKY